MRYSALIIGYGNPQRQDDSIGWHVAERLGDALARPGVEIIACHQLTLELAESISRTDLVVFVDASLGANAGAVDCSAVVPQLVDSLATTHALSPGLLLALSRELYGVLPAAWLVSVTGSCFGHGLGLSPEVQASVEPAVALIKRLIDLPTE